MSESISYLNPEGLLQNPAFSQIVVTQGAGKTIYIGGQNAVNPQREVVGKGDLKAQTEQVMRNIQIALAACEATTVQLVKLSIHIVQGQNLYEAFQASQAFLAGQPHPPAITVLIVAGLANPDFLVEIDAVAFIPN